MSTAGSNDLVVACEKHWEQAANGQWQARMDRGTVTLLNPDKTDRPTAWDGPLRIQISPAAPCEADLSLVTRVYGARAAQRPALAAPPRFTA